MKSLFYLYGGGVLAAGGMEPFLRRIPILSSIHCIRTFLLRRAGKFYAGPFQDAPRDGTPQRLYLFWSSESL